MENKKNFIPTRLPCIDRDGKTTIRVTDKDGNVTIEPHEPFTVEFGTTKETSYIEAKSKSSCVTYRLSYTDFGTLNGEIIPALNRIKQEAEKILAEPDDNEEER